MWPIKEVIQAARHTNSVVLWLIHSTFDMQMQTKARSLVNCSLLTNNTQKLWQSLGNVIAAPSSNRGERADIIDSHMAFLLTHITVPYCSGHLLTRSVMAAAMHSDVNDVLMCDITYYLLWSLGLVDGGGGGK